MNRQKIEQRIEELEAEILDLNNIEKASLGAFQSELACEGSREIEFNERVIDELQSLLDEPEQQPLDTPTHDGWWFHSEHPTSLFLVEKDIIQEIFISGGCDFKHIKEIKNWSGKWLPANNPFGKGEG